MVSSRQSGPFFLAVGLVMVFVLIWSPGPLLADTVDDLNLLTENFAPFNFNKDGKIQGISVDILVEMLALAGSTKGRQDIRVLPWTKGYNAAQFKKNTLLFGMIRTKAREPLFKWVGPMYMGSVAVLAKKSRRIRINTLDDLNQYTIGVVRDDVAEQLLLQGGVKRKSLYETVSGTGGENLGKMLNADRIDLWAYGKITALWNLRELGLFPGDFESVYALQNRGVFFALHKETDDHIVSQLQKALDVVRGNGKLKEIIEKYLPGF